MKILLAGDWHSGIHEESAFQAMKNLGHEVTAFAWFQYFKQGSSISHLLGRAQNKYLLGPTIDRLNHDLARMALKVRPDIIFIYRGTHVYPRTLMQLRQSNPRAIIVGYNNDDPFSPAYPRWVWRHFLASIPEYDVLFAYRQHNVEDFTRAGARSAQLLMPWFTDSLHHPMTLSASELEKFKSDVCFIGHFEPDERVEYLREVSRAGVNLKIWGPSEGWADALRGIPELRNQLPVVPVRGTDYVRALSGAKIALAFFSKLNRDVYTRRSFEIPATGTFMLSAHSPQIEKLFQEKVEASYFRSADELVSKTLHYLHYNNERESIARGGYERVHSDGHESIERMRQMLEIVNDHRA